MHYFRMMWTHFFWLILGQANMGALLQADVETLLQAYVSAVLQADIGA